MDSTSRTSSAARATLAEACLALTLVGATLGTTPSRAEPAESPLSYSITTRVLWETELPQAGKCSPRAADINGDGLDDVVIGTGLEDNWGRVVALDGKSGAVLWSRRMTDEVLVAAPLLDVTGDGIPEVFIGGRKRLTDVYALNGKDGSTVWRLTESNPAQTFPPINFINLALVDDRDGDGRRDLLVVQSGGLDARRLAARFHLVGSADGKLLSTAFAPDGKECYSIPLFEARPEKPARLFVGTGGESLSGGLFKVGYPGFGEEWRVPCVGGGFIGSPMLVDLDADGREEIVASGMNGSVYRVDAESGEVAWRRQDRPYWTYVSPAVGAFDDGAALDVVAGFNRGAWPNRDGSRWVWLDGSTGEPISERIFEGEGRASAASPLVFDADGDGRDETLLVLSNPIPDASVADESHRIVILDGHEARRTVLELEMPGYSIATPRLADLDGDGKLDLVHASHYGVMRIELTVTGTDGKPRSPRTVWGEFRGPDGEGIYRRSP